MEMLAKSALAAVAGLSLLASGPVAAQGAIDYSKVANYCPSQAFKQQNPRFKANVERIRHPKGSPEYQEQYADYESAYRARMAEAIGYCEKSVSRNPYQPWR